MNIERLHSGNGFPAAFVIRYSVFDIRHFTRKGLEGQRDREREPIGAQQSGGRAEDQAALPAPRIPACGKTKEEDTPRRPPPP